MGTAEVRGWGVPPCGERFFTNQRTFVGADILSARQRNFTNLLFLWRKGTPSLFGCGLPDGGLFFRLPSWGHSPAVGGRAALRMGRTPLRVKPLFLLSAKEKAVLDSEKEKVDRWK